MEKPIIATTFAGLFIPSDYYEKAHISWFKDREKELIQRNLSLEIINDYKDLLEKDPKKEREIYFGYVNKIMKQLYPEKTDSERNKLAREDYFNSVLGYLRDNPNIVRRDFVDYFKTLKTKFRIGLITTNTESALEKILEITETKNLFNILEPSFET